MKNQKPLVDFTMQPGAREGGWGMGMPHIVTFRGAKNISGPNVRVENNSTKALRVVVYDNTKEWKERKRKDTEATERAQLAALKAKYDSKPRT